MWDIKNSTGRHIEKQWKLLLFIQQRNCCDIGVNHWAETNIHTVPLKQWLAQWSSKAWGRLRHMHAHTHTHRLTWARRPQARFLTHTHLHLHQISYTSVAAQTAALSLSLPLMCSEVRGQGSPLDQVTSIPCFCLKQRLYQGWEATYHRDLNRSSLWYISKHHDPQQ